MQPPSRCRIPKNAPRAALHRTRGFYWENSAPSLSFRSRLRCESRNQGRQAPRVLSLSAQPCKYLLYTGLSRGVRLYRRSLRVVEPLARTAYNPDIRAWPCFVAHLAVCLPVGNADFGQAIARWSCGRDYACAGKGGHDGYWHCEMVQPDERLWIHSAAGWRQRRIRPYLRCRTCRL